MMENEKGLSADVTNTVVTESEKTQGKSQAVSVDTAETPKGLSIRHLVLFLLGLGILVSYGMRVNISVGIVAMVDNTFNPDFMNYEWSESICGLILSSFFWGYFVASFPASILIQKFGPTLPLIIASLICGIITMLTNSIANLGWEYMFASRFIIGMAQGFFPSCVFSICSKWIHPSERGFLMSLVSCGSPIGTVVMLSVSGYLASSSWGWPSIFYISGGVSVIWAVLYLWIGRDSPITHPWIKKEEKEFIQSTFGCFDVSSSAIPWKNILLSPPYIAIIVAHCAQNWGFFTLLSVIPTYINSVLQFDINSNAVFSSLPFAVNMLFGIVFSKISDILINRKCISIGTGRKLFNTIGMWIPAGLLILLGYVSKEEVTLAITLLTLCVGINSIIGVGFLVNFLDIAPNYSGLLMGVSNGIANVFSIIGPMFVGFVVSDASDAALWRIFFFVTAGFYFFANLVYIVFAQGTVQQWNIGGKKLPTKTEVENPENRY